MPRSKEMLLLDMREAAGLILSFTDGTSFDVYAGDVKLRSAVERQFMIIGEALCLLKKTSPEEAALVPQQRDIISFRNILVHGYSLVRHEVVWATIRQDLPELLLHLRRRIDQEDRDS